MASDETLFFKIEWTHQKNPSLAGLASLEITGHHQNAALEIAEKTEKQTEKAFLALRQVQSPAPKKVQTRPTVNPEAVRHPRLAGSEGLKTYLLTYALKSSWS